MVLEYCRVPWYLLRGRCGACIPGYHDSDAYPGTVPYQVWRRRGARSPRSQAIVMDAAAAVGALAMGTTGSSTRWRTWPSR